MRTYNIRYFLGVSLLLASPVLCHASELDELSKRVKALEERIASLEKSLMPQIAEAGVKQEQGDENRKRATWQIDLSLDTPNLVPPAVQYSVFDKDPIPGFRASLKRMQSYHQKRLHEAGDDAKRELARSSYLTVHWNLGFKEVTGDQVCLVASAPGRSQTLSSNSQDGKKWIVTKIVRIKGKPVCWCLSVDTKTGEGIEVVFTEKNAFELEAVYDDLMHASNQGK